MRLWLLSQIHSALILCTIFSTLDRDAPAAVTGASRRLTCFAWYREYAFTSGSNRDLVIQAKHTHVDLDRGGLRHKAATIGVRLAVLDVSHCGNMLDQHANAQEAVAILVAAGFVPL